jgi:hypothetical protein
LYSSLLIPAFVQLVVDVPGLAEPVDDDDVLLHALKAPATTTAAAAATT